ncbi:MAG TPA: NAD(P)H-dependent glycerol-3-phosphate dehydrogenase [Candidatus Obscuribacterales bacterium]
MPAHEQIAILGAGTWGAVLAWLYGINGRSVSLWSHDPEKAAHLSAQRKIEKPLAIAIPESVRITGDLAAAVSGADIVVVCCTSQSMRLVAGRLAEALAASGSRPTLVSAVKGLELGTFKRMSEILCETLPHLPVCALSGPNLAAEILAGRPAASVAACADLETARAVQRRLSVPSFRVYANDDLAGVELGGSLKNIIAIAAGSSDGLELGANARAALLTRGLAEMTRLAVALGARPLTLSGLAGMGDLFATCSSALSRNYRLGYAMAQGKSPQEALAALGATAEGVPTTEAVCELSKRLGIEMPIAEQVEATLKGKSTPQGAIMTLMTRPLAIENPG